MREQSKATTRRLRDWRFTNRWFVGKGIDVGCGPDPMDASVWPKVSQVDGYDLDLGHRDAQYLPEIPDKSVDFVHSSHCLEHLRDTRSALTNWKRVVKPGGFIIATVPEEFLYEGGWWPSVYNEDHKNSFTLRSDSVLPGSINLVQALWKLEFDVELIQLLTEGWDVLRLGEDQTLGEAECAIEFVIRVPRPNQPW